MERRASGLLSSTSTTRERLYTATARLHLPHSCIMPPAIRMSATLSSTSKSIPRQRAGSENSLSSYSPNCQTARITCPSRPGFAIDCPFFTASSRLNIPISMPLPPDALFPGSLLPSTLPEQSCAAIWRRSIHLARFPNSHACAPGNATRIHAILATHLSRRGSAKRRKERHTGAYF